VRLDRFAGGVAFPLFLLIVCSVPLWGQESRVYNGLQFARTNLTLGENLSPRVQPQCLATHARGTQSVGGHGQLQAAPSQGIYFGFSHSNNESSRKPNVPAMG